MNKNQHISRLDLHQMQLNTLDESNDAQRVVIVGQELNIDASALKEAISEGLKDIKINVSSDVKAEEQQKSVEIVYVPTIVKEVVIERIEVPFLVYETKTVEIPVVVPEIRIVEIEKPVIVTEVKLIEVVKENFNKNFMYLNIGLTILNILIMLSKLIK